MYHKFYYPVENVILEKGQISKNINFWMPFIIHELNVCP